MTQPEFTGGIVDPTNNIAPVERPVDPMNKFEPLSLEERVKFVAVLAVDANFDREDHLARRRLRMAYDGLPKELSREDVGSLAYAVAVASTSREIIEGVKVEKPEVHERQASRRAVVWLGGMSHLHGDAITTRNTGAVLRRDFGLRGKFAALSLWYEKTIKN